LGEEFFEPLELCVGEVRGPMRMGLGREAIGLLGGLSPAVERGAVDAQAAGDDGRRFAGIDEFDGPSSAPFEFFGCSKWSAHEMLDGTNVNYDSLVPQRAINKCQHCSRYYSSLLVVSS
jgi:hypothetical protein